MITADIKKTSSYAEITDSSRANISKLKLLGVDIPDSSWIYEALAHAELAEKQRAAGSLEVFTSDHTVAWKTTIVFGNLSEFNFIISKVDQLLITSREVVKKKLYDVLRMPLKMLDENSDTGTNSGRNTLFELRLAARFVASGYETILCAAHPDILIQSNGKEYAIECKRIFSVKSFENLTFDAINQLEDYSLSNFPNRLGIVAVSITRSFHKGDKKLYADKSEIIAELADKETERFLKEHLEFIHRKFPQNIPCIILDFSDLAESDMPYWVHWLFLVETARSGSTSEYHHVLNDLKNMMQNTNE